ncbi:MAG: hypothetical protein RL293_1497 [Bacteroidota bacterium]|jgi:hypothetical protein
MKMKLLLFICLVTFTNVKAQSTKQWKVEGIQINFGGLMSSKIPSASYATYADFIGETDTTYTDFSAPVQLTNLRLHPIFNGSLHVIQPEKNVIHRFGLTIQNKSISSFVLIGTPDIDSTTNIEVYSSIAAYRLDHTSPVLTFDYAFLKKVSLSQRFNLTVGAGAYVGYSLWNTIKSRARINQWPSGNESGSLWNGRSTSDNFTRDALYSFSKHTLNLGLYTSFGFEYGLSSNQNVAQKWYFTYESRFCYDYFAVKSVPSSWFSFQCSQQLGIKYYLNR